MAISSLEQRLQPLVEFFSFWNPWGPGRTCPGVYLSSDSDDEQEAAEQFVNLSVRRRNSWGGYMTHADAMYMLQLLGQKNDPLPELIKEDRAFTDEPQTGQAHDDALEAKAATDFLSADTKKPKRKKGKADKTKRDSVASEKGGNQQSPQPPGNASESPSESNNAPNVPGPITTLMIRNMPYCTTQAELLEEVDTSGFYGLYDFCYLPHKFAKHRNLGFAFINFVTPEDAAKFRIEWHNSRRFGATDGINISEATVQGKAANEKKAGSLKMSRVRSPYYRPLIIAHALHH